LTTKVSGSVDNCWNLNKGILKVKYDLNAVLLIEVCRLSDAYVSQLGSPIQLGMRLSQKLKIVTDTRYAGQNHRYENLCRVPSLGYKQKPVPMVRETGSIPPQQCHWGWGYYKSLISA
jgi:hypothetical protein